ncbi:MAG TPA: hypothetical protein VGD72_08325 [Mycobacteriales bacterium]
MTRGEEDKAMHPDQGKFRGVEPSGSAPEEAAEGQAGGAPAADVGPVGRTPATAREQDAGVSGGTGATGATALDRGEVTPPRGGAVGPGGEVTPPRGEAVGPGGEDEFAVPGDEVVPELEDLGKTSPGGDGTDRSVGRDTARGDLAGTPTGDLGGADSEDIHQARITGARDDQR